MLNELRYIGSDLLRQAIDIFLADVPRQLAALRQVVAARNAAALERTAHKLKGTALGVGARQLAGVAAVVEEAARAGHFDTAVTAAATLDETFAAARTALEREDI